MDIGKILLILSLGLVVLWTVRLALSKGRSPWFWGGASLVLMFLPPHWRILSMVPMLLLLFFARKAQPQTNVKPGRVDCPRCQTHHTSSDRYCMNCGWELGKRYSESPASGKDVSGAPVARAGLEKVAAGTTAAPPAAPAPEAPSSSKPTAEVDKTPPQESPAPQEKPAAAVPVFAKLPTAPSMTERGVGLFNQGRVQEAIDQFTKAIALDPTYKEAWAHRSEAYARLGRGKEAAEDTRRLEAI
ncbi:MAG: tetratricopeptide repeat protein [Chloroflexota bacterium]